MPIAEIIAPESLATGRESTRLFQTFVGGNIGQADSGRGAIGAGVGAGVDVGAGGDVGE